MNCIAALAAALILPAAEPVWAQAGGSVRFAAQYAAAELDEDRFDGWLVAFAAGEKKPARMEWISEDICLAQNLKTVAALEKACEVVAVEPNYEIVLMDESGETPGGVSNGWAYEAMQTEYARERGLTGSGIRIAVLDSGIDPADPDLEDAVIAEGYNVFDESTNVTDDVGHGTIVSAMIAGDADDTGVTGIAPGAQIVPVKMTAAGKTSHLSDVVKAMQWAMNADVDVINMSFAYRADRMSEIDLEQHTVTGRVMDAAADQGIVTVAAAGNVSSSYPAGTVVYPAAFDSVIGVGSVDQSKSSYSGTLHTEAVYVCAPGRYVYYKGTSRSGTSYAAPCVAGAAALLLEQEPELTPADVMERIRTRAEDLGEPGYDVDYGHGFVRIDRLLHQEHTFETTVLTEPGCTTDGESAEICSFCGEIGERNVLPAAGHDFAVTKVKKATLKADGEITETCSRCGEIRRETVTRLEKIALYATVVTYNGKARKATVIVTDADGKTISPEHYDVVRPAKSADVGTYSVTVTMKSPYSGKKVLTYIIRPQPTEIRKLTSGSGSIRVVWKKQAVQTTGYQIQIARDAAFTKEKALYTVRDPAATAKTITGLKKKRTYYVRVRTFLKTPERNYYSMWKDIHSIKTAG